MATSEVVLAQPLRRKWSNPEIPEEVVPWEAVTSGEDWTREGEKNHPHSPNRHKPLPHQPLSLLLCLYPRASQRIPDSGFSSLCSRIAKKALIVSRGANPPYPPRCSPAESARRLPLPH